LQIRDSSRKGREVQRRKASCRKFKKFRKYRKIREVWEVREIRANRSKRSGISIWMIRKFCSMINLNLLNKKQVLRIYLTMKLRNMPNKKKKNLLMLKNQTKKRQLMLNQLTKNLKQKKPKIKKILKKLIQLKTKLKNTIKLIEKWPKITAKH
jgi:hypothetical protein